VHHGEPDSESLEPVWRRKQAERRSSEAGGKSELPRSGIVTIMSEGANLVGQPSFEKAAMSHETRIPARSDRLAHAGTKDIIEIRYPG
jgi:hypothetical protein